MPSDFFILKTIRNSKSYILSGKFILYQIVGGLRLLLIINKFNKTINYNFLHYS